MKLKRISSLKNKIKMLVIYSPPCHPRCPFLSFFSLKEIKVFDENFPGFSPYDGLHWEPVQFQCSFKGL